MKTSVNELSSKQREIVMKLIDAGFQLTEIPNPDLTPEEVYAVCFSDIFEVDLERLLGVGEDAYDFIIDLVIKGYDFEYLIQMLEDLKEVEGAEPLVYLNAASRLDSNTFEELYEEGYDGLQLYTIAEGFENDVDVTIHITPEYDIDQIEQIATALIYDVDMSLVNDVNLSREEMEEIINEAAFC